MKAHFHLAAVGLVALLASACSDTDRSETVPRDCAPTIKLEGHCRATSNDVPINHIQTVGSHNSYKRAIPELELATIREASPEWAMALDYAHIPLTEQLDLGMRQVELDVYYDPEGGRYADPLLPRMTQSAPGAEKFDGSGLTEPGFKVLHVQDVDPRSHCATFVACLSEIKTWSDANTGHVPILILLNAKDAKINFPETVEPLPFDAAAYDVLDAEIRSVFDKAQLVVPDDVRQDAPTLRMGALAGNWPTLDESRGKVIFALDEPPEKVTTYMRGNYSLEGLPIFVNSISEEASHAAYFTMNDPLKNGDQIKEAVRAGFLVRTRADADTREARANNTARRDAALQSGAQYVSTDYYVPRTEFGDYSVSVPGGDPARCNPVTRGADCAAR